MGVGFVGLGDIGAPMARRLAACHQLKVWARRSEATRGFAEIAGELEDLADCELVSICVSDDAAVAEVVGRLLAVLRRGAIVCVHSTVLPSTVRDLARQLEDIGVGLVDAPVSGGSDGAARGELLVFLGGRPDDVERSAPVLVSLGTLHVLGGVGAGQTAKIINNALYTAQAALGAAALDLGEQLGLARRSLADAVLVGSGGSFALGRLGRIQEPARAGHVAGLLEQDLQRFAVVAGADGTTISSVAHPLIGRLRSIADGDRTDVVRGRGGGARDA